MQYIYEIFLFLFYTLEFNCYVLWYWKNEKKLSNNCIFVSVNNHMFYTYVTYIYIYIHVIYDVNLLEEHFNDYFPIHYK